MQRSSIELKTETKKDKRHEQNQQGVLGIIITCFASMKTSRLLHAELASFKDIELLLKFLMIVPSGADICSE